MTSHKIIMVRITGLFLFLFSFLLAPMVQVCAQEEEGVAAEGTCAFTLQEAQSLYDQGLIENIPDMLQECIRSGFTKEERQDAYKLIILAYLFDDNQDMANEEMLAFLKRYPEYEITPTDPVEFTYLYNTYDTEHKFTYGLCIGGNLNHGFMGEPFSVGKLTGNADQVYKPAGIGLSGGLRLNFLLATNLELSVEGIFNLAKFKNEQEPIFGNIIQNAPTETHMRIDVPLTVTYDFPVGDFKPYLRAGGKVGYLMSASYRGMRKYLGETDELDDLTGSDLDISPLRRQVNFWAVAGAGVKYKIPYGYLILDLRYDIGLMDLNDLSKSRYNATDDVQEMNWLYMDTDDIFRLNHIMFSLGYQRTFYRPKKINK